MRLWKVSHGTGAINDNDHAALLKQQLASVHKNTKAKGISAVSQGEAFVAPERAGDVFFLCRGNRRIELVGLFCGEACVDAEGWATRSYEVLALNSKKAGGVTLPKWWSPSANSTFIEIPERDFEEFQTEILKPFFNLTITKLMQRVQEQQSNQMRDTLCRILQDHHQIILTGAPGTGKTHLARAVAAKLIGVADSALESSQHPQFEFIQFHQSYDYSDFIEGLKPVKGQNGIVFELRPGVFKRFCEKARAAHNEDSHKAQSGQRKFVFVIDEINRADLSRVFGEVFFAIEPSYRGRPVTTQYASLAADDGVFSVPPNVLIIGTMNDIDRSVESIDFALRRRFAWMEIHANDECFDRVMRDMFLPEEDELVGEAKKRYAALNREIAEIESLGASYHVGPAYFRRLAKYKMHPDSMWANLWNNHLELLLREYLRGMPALEKRIESLKDAFDLKSEQSAI